MNKIPVLTYLNNKGCVKIYGKSKYENEGKSFVILSCFPCFILVFLALNLPLTACYCSH